MNIEDLVTFDIECYPNYVLLMFKRIKDGKEIYFEKFNDSQVSINNVLHVINKYCIVTFNGIKYDTVIAEALVAGFSNASIYKVSQMLIEDNMQPWQVRKQVGIPALQFNHIDIIEVCPLQASLKIYGGRIHSPKMQDLPIEPGTIITEDMLPDMRLYCGNDNEVTGLVTETLKEELELREHMSEQYGVDLRSKSDAQIAEAVIKSELDHKYDIRATRPKIEPGTKFRYRPPANLRFESSVLQDILEQYSTLPIVVDKSGYTSFNFRIGEEDRVKSGKNKGNLPDKKAKLKFTFGKTKYTIGIGGLHSNEKSERHEAKGCIIRDYDVASYYPFIILNNNLAPKHLGKPFLKIFKSIVDRRLHAKRIGDRATNESLKITINGSFGKFGSKWSCLYAPDLMLQVTITGQLSLLMLVERLEAIGVQVISGNTDGIVTKFDPSLESQVEDIVSDWEFETGYTMEGTDYASLNSRDINNYIAVKPGFTDSRGKKHPPSAKGKGAYADQSDPFYRLRSNPTNEICTHAVKEFLIHGTPVEETINACDDIRQFISLRTVNGGAQQHGEYIGKAIRWYYSDEELDAIHYVTSGNKVPRTEGARPIMDLPETLPKDLDFNWYIEEARSILKAIGFK